MLHLQVATPTKSKDSSDDRNYKEITVQRKLLSFLFISNFFSFVLNN